MNYQAKKFPEASVQLGGNSYAPVRYTASHSYLFEAALDREWEHNYRNGMSRSMRRAGGMVQEGGR